MLSFWKTLWYIAASVRVTNAVFLQSPISLNTSVGTVAEFFCRADAESVFWIINGISLNRLDDLQISERQGEVIDGIHTRILAIIATIEHNNTVIQCRAFTTDEDVMHSDMVLLKVQGPLQRVGDPQIIIMNGTLYLSWIPPFTLDITFVDPDVHYIIEILTIDITNAGHSFTIPCDNCPLVTPNYIFTVENPSPCDVFTFVVIPTNGAGNGIPSDPLQGAFFQVPPDLISTNPITITVLQDDQLLVKVSFSIINTIVCLFHATFVSRDHFAPAYLCHIQLSADIGAGELALVVKRGTGSSCQPLRLPFNRVFDMHIKGENRAGNSTVATLRLSTHDVQSATATIGPMPGTIVISIKYAENTKAAGHLAILVNSSDMAVAFSAPDRSKEVTTIHGLSADTYTVLVFDIGGHGFPSTAAADSKVVRVAKGSDESPPTDLNLRVEIEAQPDGVICTTCKFTTNNTLGCVAIIYSAVSRGQIVVQSISKEPFETFVKYCFFKIEFDTYTVAVFNMESSNKIALYPSAILHITATILTTNSGSGQHLITSVVSVGGSCLVLFFALVAAVVCWQKIKKLKVKDQTTIEVKENAAYEIHKLPHTHPQPTELQPCAAYGVISSH